MKCLYLFSHISSGTNTYLFYNLRNIQFEGNRSCASENMQQPELPSWLCTPNSTSPITRMYVYKSCKPWGNGIIPDGQPLHHCTTDLTGEIKTSNVVFPITKVSKVGGWSTMASKGSQKNVHYFQIISMKLQQYKMF